MKKVLSGFGIFLGILLVIYAIGILSIGIKGLFQPLTTAEQSSEMSENIVEQTMTAENAIETYHWFKQQYEDIKALEKKLDRAVKDYDDYLGLLPSNKDDWKRQDREELSRLKTIATGIANMLDQAIADYDAKAKMSDKAIFKDDLPADIFTGVKTGMELLGGR